MKTSPVVIRLLNSNVFEIYLYNYAQGVEIVFFSGELHYMMNMKYIKYDI